MRKQVYGKRTKHTVFAASDIFTESSPARTKSRPTTSHNDTQDVEAAAAALENLKIASDDSESLPVRSRRRRALSDRDANSQVTKPQRANKVTEEQSDKASVKSSTPRDNVSEESTASSRGAKRKVLAKAMNRYTCDPYILRLVAQTREQLDVRSFDEWSAELERNKLSVSKIAEASYSEVYRLSLLREHPSLPTSEESVLKLIAIKPPLSSASSSSSDTSESDSAKSEAQQEKEDNMSAVSDIESEVRLLKRMRQIPGFTNFRALQILRGRPSKSFINAWTEWNKRRPRGQKSEFPNPRLKASYAEDQYWAVIEMQDAGTDVEKLLEEEDAGASTKTALDPDSNEEADQAMPLMRSTPVIWDIFWQTAIAVAKGESEARFEHRDLHLGNICVRRKLSRSVSPSPGRICSSGLEITLIDYTLSRAELHSQIDFSPEVAHFPLDQHPEIFEGEGDSQYQRYRDMRTLIRNFAAVEGDPEDALAEEAERDSWGLYHPRTNLLWLSHVLEKLLVDPKMEAKPQVRSSRRSRAKVAVEDEENEVTEDEQCVRLRGVLGEVQDLLKDERVLHNEENEILVGSATELLAWAVEEEWLSAEDIVS